MTPGDAIMPLGLDHVVLRVTDIERAIAFYRDVLGFAVERRLDPLGLIQLRAGHSLIDLVGIDSPLDRGNPSDDDDHDAKAKFAARNMHHFAIALSEFDETAIRAQLDRFGVAAEETRRLYGAEGFGPSIYLRDPDGNTVELKGPAEPGSRVDPTESPKE